MRLLAILEGASSASTTTEISISTIPVGPSSALPESAIIHVCPALAPSKPSCYCYYSTLGILTKFEYSVLEFDCCSIYCTSLVYSATIFYL